MNAFSTDSMADDLLRWSKQLEALGGAVISMASNEADDVSFDLYGENWVLPSHSMPMPYTTLWRSALKPPQVARDSEKRGEYERTSF